MGYRSAGLNVGEFLQSAGSFHLTRCVAVVFDWPLIDLWWLKLLKDWIYQLTLLSLASIPRNSCPASFRDVLFAFFCVPNHQVLAVMFFVNRKTSVFHSTWSSRAKYNFLNTCKLLKRFRAHYCSSLFIIAHRCSSHAHPCSSWVFRPGSGSFDYLSLSFQVLLSLFVPRPHPLLDFHSFDASFACKKTRFVAEVLFYTCKDVCVPIYPVLGRFHVYPYSGKVKDMSIRDLFSPATWPKRW